MAMKELLYRLQPVQIYIVLVLSIVYFLVQLFLSHITHALTLLVDSYHMLCNIVALTGCIVTIKHCSNTGNSENSSQTTISKSTDESKFIEINEHEAHRHERSLRNTFGWTRIDILTMLIVGIFLAAFCFSLLVEAIQTLIHIDHQDTMHHPIAVASLGGIGLILNVICYLLIGGYTYHQGSFLHITSTGDVVLDRVVSGNALRAGKQRLSKTKREQIQTAVPTIEVEQTPASSKQVPERKTSTEILRDLSSTIFVIICSAIVYLADNENVTKYVDPIISIISCITLLVLSYPYMKESCLILLQTIPGTIDIEIFKADLLKTFDDIVSVHDLHIWQLTASKYVSTVHILFQDPIVYVEIKDAVVDFFHDQGIQIVTIQPEFNVKSMDNKDIVSINECLIGCQSIECAPKTCCSTTDLDSILIDGDQMKKSKYSKSKSGKKSNSLLSLNVSALIKFRKMTGSTPDIIKKSVSESHVGQISSDDEQSKNTSANISQSPSAINFDTHPSIEELKEDDVIDETLSDKTDKDVNAPKVVVNDEENGLLKKDASNRLTKPEVMVTDVSDEDVLKNALHAT